MPSPPRFRRDYSDDPKLCGRVFRLFEAYVTGISNPRRAGAKLGMLWEDSSTSVG